MKKVKDTNYNKEQNRRVSTKTVQVQQEEYIKCQKGEEFKVRVITHAKPKITLEDVIAEMRAGFERIDDRLNRNGLKP